MRPLTNVRGQKQPQKWTKRPIRKKGNLQPKNPFHKKIFRYNDYLLMH